MRRTIDRSARQDITNALAILEQYRIVEHSNFFTQKGDMDVWAYSIENKSVRITQTSKTEFDLEVLT